MPTLQLIITDAGRQAIVNETNAGTLPVTLTEIALGTGKWSPDATATALQAEIKRITAVGGLAVAPDTIHITCTDDSTDAYALGEFGIYTDSGVLFAIYSDPLGITDKAADALLLLAADAVLTSVPPGSVTVNGVGFSNPPATESAPGIAEIATQAESDAGTDDVRIVTPKKAKASAAAYQYTADQALATPANTGTLAQLLSWIAGRLMAITGKTDWKTAPATTLEAAKSHIDSTAPHGATSLATATRLMLRDANGRAKVAAPSAADDIARKAEADAVQAGLDSHSAATAPHSATSAATANRLMLRDANGRAKVAAPAVANDIARLDTVQNAIAALIGGAPGTLDTLNELAAALGDDPNFATTMANALAGKQPLDATLTALAALATAADKLIYATGNDAFSTTTLTAFARTLLDDTSGAAMFNTMGAQQSIAPNGYQKLPSGLILQWGVVTAIGGGVDLGWTFPIAFPNGWLNARAEVNASGSTDYASITSAAGATTSLTFRKSNPNSASTLLFAIGH